MNFTEADHIVALRDLLEKFLVEHAPPEDVAKWDKANTVPLKFAKLFADLGKQHSDRQGGYTRIIRVGNRPGDAAEMAILEWTGTVLPAPAPEEGKTGKEVEAKSEKPVKAEAAKK